MKLMKECGTWYVPTIIAGEFVMDIALMKRVDFVMKGGVVYKRDGEPTNAALSSSLGQ